MRLAVEDAEFLDVVARNLFTASSRLSTRAAWEAWARMSPDEKEPWYDEVVAEMRAEMSREPDPDPEPIEPGPGSGVPNVEIEDVSRLRRLA